MSDSNDSLIITIGDQELRLRAAPDEHARLRRVAQLADQALRDARGNNTVVGGPRLWAMALFQLALELDEAQETQRRAKQGSDRLSKLISRIDRATGK